jgi:peptide/nickel transport system ATP-binding protein
VRVAGLLSVEDVSVDLPTPRGNLRAVDHVDLTVGAGRTSASSAIRLRQDHAVTRDPAIAAEEANFSGRVMFDGQDLVRLAPERLRRLRGRELAVVFQDPMTSLNPVLTIGTQLIETLQGHLELDLASARKRSVELLAAVGIPAPEQRLAQYPHQLSGGMRQRVAIAIALSCEPKLLIADEPTTALDVTIQAQILDLLAREQRRRHMAMILITHDLGVVAGRTDEVAVMYAGRVSSRRPPPCSSRWVRALLAALPKLTPRRTAVAGVRAGRPIDAALKGCSSRLRRYATGRCQQEKPSLAEAGRIICTPASIRSRPRLVSPHDGRRPTIDLEGPAAEGGKPRR